MDVDGKNLRIRKLIFRLFLFLSISSSWTFAENSQPLRSVDLTRDLCKITQIEVNTPEVGVEFISENEVLAYTVCQGTGEPTFSVRDHFQASDSEHLKAAIFNVSTGKVEHHYDWPTHGDRSFITVTKKGNLLVVRDNFLDTYDLSGNQVAHLKIEKVYFQDPLLMVPSYATGSIAVTEIAMTVKKVLLTATLVLDADTLHPLFKWNAKNEPEDRVIAASPEMAAAWQEVKDEKHVVIRTPKDAEWNTVWTGKSSSMIGPQFLDASKFVIATDDAILFFNHSGEVENQINVKAPTLFIVARDGQHLAVAHPEDSPSAAFAPATRLDVYGPSWQRIATFTNFNNLKRFFSVALSPSGNKLAILGDMQVTVFGITQPQ